MTYSEDELLPLSGIQHFLFCRRQWALIHIENQWQENVFTFEGRQLHERVDDPTFNETRKGHITVRSMPVVSYELGLNGICDVVEFQESPDGIPLKNREGTYTVMPVEYKRGHEKASAIDDVQLCAQAICLEEMLVTNIPQGAVFYGETRRRSIVLLTRELRDQVYQLSREMHDYFQRGYTPNSKPTKACKSCSLVDICLPEVTSQPNRVSVYIRQNLEG
jgi:CRISPR-associated exonuclease Cas4